MTTTSCRTATQRRHRRGIVLALLSPIILSSCAAAPFLLPIAFEFARNLIQTGLSNYGSKHRDNLSNLVDRLASPYMQGLPPMSVTSPGAPGQAGFMGQGAVPGQPVMGGQPGFPNQPNMLQQQYPGQQAIAGPTGTYDINNSYGGMPQAYPGSTLGFSGTIYIKRAGETITSNLVPFRFEPILVIRDYKMPAMLSDYRYEFPVQFPDSTKHSAFLINGNVFSGLTGTNEYFPNTTLKNGWVLDEVYYSKGSLSCLGGCSYLLEKRIGSNQPYFSIRYWVNAADFGSSKFTSYLIDRISLRGPKGVPDGLACTQTPCSE